jgi:hypothetical protein
MATGIGIGGLFSARFLSGLVVVLVPVSWSFVVVRAIQGESLVGDRQFWVTRPYEWKKLLAAKVLFALTFVNLPLLFLDVFLLAKAGFAPRNYWSGLLWMELMIVLYFMLPVAALATVTATVVQMLLALLIIVLYGIGMGLLSDYIPSSSFSGSADSLTAALLFWRLPGGHFYAICSTDDRQVATTDSQPCCSCSVDSCCYTVSNSRCARISPA